MAYKTVNISGGEELKKKLAKITGNIPKLNVGFLSSEEAYIATIQEFGVTIQVTAKMRYFLATVKKIYLKKETTTITIPPRPFMQMTFDKHHQEWSGIFNKLFMNNNFNVEISLEQLGTYVVGNIQTMISNGDFIENSAATVKIKGFNKPLIDKGSMLRGVSYEIE